MHRALRPTRSANNQLKLAPTESDLYYGAHGRHRAAWFDGRVAHQQNTYPTRCTACLASLASVTKEKGSRWLCKASRQGFESVPPRRPRSRIPTDDLADRPDQSAAAPVRRQPSPRQARHRQRPSPPATSAPAAAAPTAAAKTGGSSAHQQHAAGAAKVQPKGSITLVLEAEPDTDPAQGRHDRQRDVDLDEAHLYEPLVGRRAGQQALRQAGREPGPESDRPEDLASSCARA